MAKPVKKLLIKIIDGVLSPPKTKSTYKAKPAFKPSMLGTPCLRKLYYSYLRVDEDFAFPLNITKICKLGDSVGELLSEFFRSAGVLVDYRLPSGKIPINKYTKKPDPEFPIKDSDLEISLKIDAVLIIDGVLWLGEYKSINSFGYGKLKAPKPEHLVQGTTYFYLFNKALKDGVFKHIKELDGFTAAAGIKFIYYNKDTSAMKEFTYEEGAVVFRNTLIKMGTVKEHVKNKSLPPKTQDWCQSCSWRTKCVSNQLN